MLVGWQGGREEGREGHKKRRQRAMKLEVEGLGGEFEGGEGSREVGEEEKSGR